MSISNLGMKPHSFSQTSVVNQMSSSQTASKSTKLMPKRGQSQKFVKARSTNVPPRPNYQNLRKSLNNGVGVQRSMTSPPPPAVGLSTLTQTVPVQHNDGVSQSAALGAALGQTAISILNETGLMDKLANKIMGNGNQTNSQAIDTALSSIGNNNSSVASQVSTDTGSTISAMTSANDPASLGKAINDAKATLNSMDSMTTHLDAESMKAQDAIPTCQASVTDAQGEVDSMASQVSQGKQNIQSQQTNRDVAQSNYDKACDALGEKGQELKQAKADYTQKRDASVKADAAYTSAQNNTQIAQTNLQSAEATLSATPQTITDSNGISVPNPAYAKAQTAVNTAKAELEKAKGEEDKAKTQADDCAKAMQDAEKTEMNLEKEMGIAKDSADAAKAQVAEQTQNLEIAQNKLDNAISGESRAQDKLNTANNNLSNAQTQLSDLNGAVTKFKQHLQDMSNLSTAITQQEQRLEQMNSNSTEKESSVKKTDKTSGNDKSGGVGGEKMELQPGVKTPEMKDVGPMIYNDNSTKKFSEYSRQELEQMSLTDLETLSHQIQFGNGDKSQEELDSLMNDYNNSEFPSVITQKKDELREKGAFIP